MNPHDDALSSVQPINQHRKLMPAPHKNDVDIFKPLSYIQDPRMQPQRPYSSNDTLYQYNPISTTGSVSNQKCMLPPAPRSMLPSQAFGSNLSHVGNSDTRPISAPESYAIGLATDSVPISQMLPPVRELPFANERTVSDDWIVAANVRGKSSVEPAVKKEKPPPKKKRAPANPKRTKKTKAVEITVDNLPSPSGPFHNQASAESKGFNEPPPSSAPPQSDSTLAALEHTVSKLSSNLTPPTSRGGAEAPKKRPLSAVSDNERNKRQARVSSPELAATVEQQSSQPKEPTAEPSLIVKLPTASSRPANPVLAPITPAEFLDSLDTWIKRYQHLPVPEPAEPRQAPPSMMTAKEQLAEYASKDDEERAKIIDEMICECLQDENFGKMTDDLEGHWKRICLES